MLRNELLSIVPPFSLEAEQRLLGSIIARGVLDPIAKDLLLTADDFHLEQHRVIYSAIVELERAEGCHFDRLIRHIRSRGCIADAGGEGYIEQLVMHASLDCDVRQDISVLRSKAALRAFLKLLHELSCAALASYVDTDDLLAMATRRLMALVRTRTARSYLTTREIVNESTKHLDDVYDKATHGKHVNGVKSGFPNLDEVTSGFQPSDLIVVAAHPSTGKTAFCAHVALHACVGASTPVLIFSLEMSRRQLMDRIVFAYAGVDPQKSRKGSMAQVDWPAVVGHAGQISVKKNLFIDDTAGITLKELYSAARHAKICNNIGMIIVDYIDLIAAGSSGEQPTHNRKHVLAILRTLKTIARELNIPVVALSYLEPTHYDTEHLTKVYANAPAPLAIESHADADLIMTLDRAQPADPTSEHGPGFATLRLVKHRNGITGEFTVKFLGDFSRFVAPPPAAPDGGAT